MQQEVQTFSVIWPGRLSAMKLRAKAIIYHIGLDQTVSCQVWWFLIDLIDDSARWHMFWQSLPQSYAREQLLKAAPSPSGDKALNSTWNTKKLKL